MIKHLWRSGPPPHIGWWNASVNKANQIWRWWNGEYWSRVAHEETDDSELASIRASKKSIFNIEDIFWTDYWPENARVPRINPGERKWINKKR